jgi:hypothetical protein
MKPILVVVFAVAAIAQQPRLSNALDVPWNYIDFAGSLNIDNPIRYHNRSLILRNRVGEPLVFCNMKMQRCWALDSKREATGYRAIVDEHQKTISVLVEIVKQLTDRAIALETKP